MSDPLRVFISYRRSDCLPQANALYDGLKHRLKDAEIFRDLDSIPPGVDFERHIRSAIARTHVVLVMIGDDWLASGHDPTQRRIDEEHDFVRLEVESALAIDSTRLIPVLVEGAPMPRMADLPASISRLARFNAFELSDQRWSQDIQRLTDTIEQVRREVLGQPSAPEAPRPPSYVAPRPPSPPAPTRAPAPPPPPASTPASTPPRTQAPTGRTVLGVSPQTMLSAAPFAVTCCSCGLLAPVATGWLAYQHQHAPWIRRKLLAWTGALTAALILSVVLMNVAPVDEDGVVTGVTGNLGVILFLLVPVAALALLGVYRPRAGSLAGASAALDRRRAREEYRTLVRNDPQLARSMNVGRPDLARDYDDGGLVDLNSIPTSWLRDRSPLTPAEVESIAEVREQLGSFGSVDELLAFSPSTRPAMTQWLQEHAITL
jgi:hypothetical protein